MARETKMYRTVCWTLGEGEGKMIRENSIETCILPYVKQIISPVQCMKQGTQSWCIRTTLRDGMGRDVEGGFRTGDTCTPMADSC